MGLPVAKSNVSATSLSAGFSINDLNQRDVLGNSAVSDQNRSFWDRAIPGDVTSFLDFV
jgi:hypothetical protein